MGTFLIKESNAEALYDRNRKHMMKARRQLTVSRLFCVVGNIILAVISAARSFIWFSSLAYTARIVGETGETEVVSEQAFPLMILLVFYMPVMAILALLSDAQGRPFLLRICAYSSMALMVITLFNALLQVSATADNVFTMIYLGCEIAFSFLGLAAYNEMDSLKGQEGYPDFDYAVQRAMTSEQKKYMEERQQYLARQNAGLRSDDPERASDDIVTVSGKSDEMDGVSVNMEDQERWFTNSAAEQEMLDSEETPADMDSTAADPFFMPSDDQYEVHDRESILKRPL